jgi:hypothetical protein
MQSPCHQFLRFFGAKYLQCGKYFPHGPADFAAAGQKLTGLLWLPFASFSIRGRLMRRAMMVLLTAALALATQGMAHASIVPHRAIYDLTMRVGGEGGATLGVTGRMVIELSTTCEAYLLNQRMLTRVIGPDGEARINDFRIAALESRTGMRFRFAIENYVDGRLTEVESGNARLANPGGGGVAIYQSPEARTRNLPDGTVFPVASNNLVLEAAIAGRNSLHDTVFDGSGDGLYLTTTFIGKRRPPGSAGADKFGMLAQLASWSVQTAYFSFDEKGDLPEFEVSFRMFENGVSGDMVLDYGDVVLAGTLVELVPLEVPDCN